MWAGCAERPSTSITSTAEIGGIVGYVLHIFGLVRVQIMKVWYYNIIGRCYSLVESEASVGEKIMHQSARSSAISAKQKITNITEMERGRGVR